ncbi:SHOCT domain-containing protein [Micromonospora sp. CPCC 205371]|nr:SHOCT domain-containing protein [Micromonospora sp. CPCC 205371]
MAGRDYLAYDYPVLGAFWTVMWVFLWVAWIFLIFRVVVDLFRDDRLSGWVKAAWLLCVLVLPYLGVLIYLIARGRGMGEREVRQAESQKAAFDKYIRETAGTTGHSELAELERLSEIRARGDITDEEFQRAKQKILR